MVSEIFKYYANKALRFAALTVLGVQIIIFLIVVAHTSFLGATPDPYAFGESVLTCFVYIMVFLFVWYWQPKSITKSI